MKKEGLQAVREPFEPPEKLICSSVHREVSPASMAERVRLKPRTALFPGKKSLHKLAC